MGIKWLLGVLVCLLCLGGHTQQTRLVIGDAGLTVVEKIYEWELAAGEVSRSLDPLPPQTIPDSVLLREVAETPTVGMRRQVLQRVDVSGLHASEKRFIKPVWTLDVPETGRYTFKLHYLVRGMGWSGTYNVILAHDMSSVTMRGAVAIQNYTDEIHADARVVLARAADARSPEFPSGTGLTDSGFLDTDLFFLEEAVSLETHAVTSIPLFNIPSLTVAPFVQYIESRPGSRAAAEHGALWSLEVANTEANGLGIALPKGSVRLFQDLEEGILFLSSSTLDSTAPGDLLSLHLRREPGLEVRRHEEQFADSLPARSDQTLIRHTVTLSSRLERTHEVRLLLLPEGMPGRVGEVIEASDLYKTHEYGLLEFRVEIAPDSEAVITYTTAPASGEKNVF